MQTASPWLSKSPATTRRHNLRLPKAAVIGKEVLENGRPFVVADMSFRQQKQDRSPMPVTNGMKFGVQASFCLP